jgi:hypothetical protein
VGEDDGRFVLQPAPADPRFQAPRSGRYWQVDAVADEAVATAAGAAAPPAAEPAPLARSASLLSGRLQAGSDRGPRGEALWLHRETFTAPGSRTSLRVSVSLPADEARAELAAIRWPLMLGLAVLGLMLVVAQWLALQISDQTEADSRNRCRVPKYVQTIEQLSSSAWGGGLSAARRMRLYARSDEAHFASARAYCADASDHGQHRPLGRCDSWGIAGRGGGLASRSIFLHCRSL